MHVFKLLPLIIFCALSLASETVHAAQSNEWRPSAFEGQRVEMVAVHPRISNEIAVSVAGQLKLSHDGGLLWRDSPMPQQPLSLAYDRNHIGWLYCGTSQGLYMSHDNGMSWGLMDRRMTAGQAIPRIITTDRFIFIDAHGDSGTDTHVYRLTPEGEIYATGLQVSNGSGLVYDDDHRQLFAGTRDGVYVSDTEGESWRLSGSGSGAYAYDVTASGNDIWELTNGQLYHSLDRGAIWDPVVDLGEIDDNYYGGYMRPSGGLLSNNGRAFYGVYDPFYGTAVLAQYVGGAAHTSLNIRAYDLGRGGTRLWAGTQNGLWSNDNLVAEETHIARPVVLIPGILGSLPTADSLIDHAKAVGEGLWGGGPAVTPSAMALDPVRHTYDSLIAALQRNGYQLGSTLFLFPYDWLQSNTMTGRQLGDKLTQIRHACSCAQVDIVAHSMGGLVARSYIQDSTYNHDVHTLIQIATPNQGSDAAYPVWEGGQYPGVGTNNRSGLLDLIGSVLAGPTGSSVKAAVVQDIAPSIQELLPIYDYIRGRKYPDGYPRNTFLEKLNSFEEVKGLARVATYTIASDTHRTWRWLTVGGPTHAASWYDGQLLSIEDGPGDGTVLRTSVEAMTGLSALMVGDHGQIVSESAPYIINVLLNQNSSFVDINTTVTSEKLIAIATSPNTSLRISDSEGRVVSDAVTTIPGAYYTGTRSALRLAFIPASVPGPYRIEVEPVARDATPAYTLGVESLGNGSTDSGLFGPASDEAPAMLSGSVTDRSDSYLYDPISNTLRPFAESKINATNRNPDSITIATAVASSGGALGGVWSLDNLQSLPYGFAPPATRDTVPRSIQQIMWLPVLTFVTVIISGILVVITISVGRR